MTTQDICYQRLINLHQPGGESNLFDSNNLQSKLTVQFIKGGSYFDRIRLQGQINNLNLSSSAVIDPFCTEPSCIEGSGIWTTAVVTSITRDNEGITEYWVEGSLDSEGNVWVLDLGIISELTGDFIIKDKAVPINTKGYFTSKINLPEGIKLAVLKKVTPTNSETILHYFGSYKNNKKLSRAKVGYLLNYNALDQQTDLELLSISLISLIFSKYKPNNLNETRYFIKGELDFFTKQIIEDNISALADLIDLSSTNARLNSIPKTLTTYLTPDLLYNDKRYLNNLAECITNECADECVEVKEVFLTSSREVSTRAVAWFYLLVYTYTIYLGKPDYTYLLDLISFYLVNQINHSYSLPSKGWTHSDVLANSEEILEYDLSTSVVVYLALLKHYEYTNNSKYLELSTNIEEGIWTQLYNFKTKLFVNSLSDSNLFVEELAYGLLFSILVNRSDVVESLISLIASNLTVDYGVVKESLDGIDIINLDKLSAEYLIVNSDSINYTTIVNNKPTLVDLTVSNILLTYSLELAESKLYTISSFIQDRLNAFKNTLNEVEQTNSLIYTSSCVSKLNTFQTEVLFSGEYPLTNLLSFQRELLLNKLISQAPIDFGWFSKKALQLSGTTYKLIKAFSKALSTFSVHSKTKIVNNYLSALKGRNLDNYLSLFNIRRIPQETDEELKAYVKSILEGVEDQITNKGLGKKLLRYDLASSITDNFTKIFKLNSLTGNSSLGIDHYIGTNYASNNLITVIIPQPINKQISQEVVNSLPIAVKAKVIEVFSVESKLNTSEECVISNLVNDDSSYLLLESISPILTEEGEGLLQEDGQLTLLENSNDVVTTNYLLQESTYRFKLED